MHPIHRLSFEREIRVSSSFSASFLSMVNGYCYDCGLLRPSMDFTGDVPHCPHCQSEVVELLETWEAIGALNVFISGGPQRGMGSSMQIRFRDSGNNVLSSADSGNQVVNIEPAPTESGSRRRGETPSNVRTMTFVTDGQNVMTMPNFLRLLQRAGESRSSPADPQIIEALQRQARPAAEFFKFYGTVDKENSDGQCTICLAAMGGNELITQMGCAHVFHLECIKAWLQQQHTCPVCRADCTARQS